MWSSHLLTSDSVSNQWMPDKEMTMESKLVAPPRVPFLPRRPTVLSTSLPHPLFFRSPTVTTPKRRASSIARRSTAAPVTTTVPPITLPSTTISPTTTTHRRTTPHSIPTTLIPPTTTLPSSTTISTPRSGMTIRSFEKITVEKGRTRRTRVRAEVLLKGKVIEEIRFKRDGEVDFERRKRDIGLHPTSIFFYPFRYRPFQVIIVSFFSPSSNLLPRSSTLREQRWIHCSDHVQ